MSGADDQPSAAVAAGEPTLERAAMNIAHSATTLPARCERPGARHHVDRILARSFSALANRLSESVVRELEPKVTPIVRSGQCRMGRMGYAGFGELSAP